VIDATTFILACEKAGVGFFTGVPDSLLSSFSAALEGLPPQQHLIAVNEGAALGLAAGYQLATGELPLVYLQNSGLGNLINPLTSLVDDTVYAIPVLLLVGWRGQPGRPDEPQHARMGIATQTVLKAMDVPVFVLKQGDAGWEALLHEAANEARKRSGPVALVVEKGVFKEISLPQQEFYALSSSDVIEMIAPSIPRGAMVVCTTGKIGRVFYDWNKRQKNPLNLFLNVGAMGHTGSVAASLAFHSEKPVWLFDGDGSLLMHLGSLANNALLGKKNLNYFLLNNGAHESVGRQPTAGFDVDFCGIATNMGYHLALRIETKTELKSWVRKGVVSGEFVEIRINTTVPANLPRPAESPKEAGAAFRESIQKKS
jgi:phosphonopyruvate decarboxylase